MHYLRRNLVCRSYYGSLVVALVMVSITFLSLISRLEIYRDVYILVAERVMRNRTAEIVAAELLGQVVYLSPVWVQKRPEHMEAQLHHFHLSHIRDTGINAVNLSFRDLEQLYPAILAKGRCDNELSLNTVHGYINLRRLLNKVCTGELAPNNSLVLLLEDDATFHTLWGNRLMEALSTAPPGWDVLRIGGWGHQRAEDRIGDSVWFRCTAPGFQNSNGVEVWFYHGTVAMLIRSGSTEVCNYYQKRPACYADSMLVGSD
eukprot:gb/GEZN01009865.1/.p1 GENE.gb/GEZN01009865.1/~~gb/GEZN01009865.1/.p1  ORF type:complete len:260 (-),score=5.04 gb/GEZN01009865.1/:251-1030(-)